MINILLLIMALLLLVVGFMLTKKTVIFFSLIKETPQNKNFLQRFGIIYLILALFCLVVVFLDQPFLLIIFLCLILIISAIFSFSLAKKMGRQ
ncbi:MAG TPA: hypothetical protein VK118_01670 [Tetragenococcus sp.]|nr:hypothetical protein [Tetragenococcus sp.]